MRTRAKLAQSGLGLLKPASVRQEVSVRVGRRGSRADRAGYTPRLRMLGFHQSSHAYPDLRAPTCFGSAYDGVNPVEPAGDGIGIAMIGLPTPGVVAAALQPYIDRGELAGLVAFTWCRGEIVQEDALGWRDVAARGAMRRDSVFRIASMTKPVTTVMALILIEEGRLRLGDSVAEWLPELSAMRVLRHPEGPIDDTVAAERGITVEDLMTHRAGFGYSMFSRGPIAVAYAEVVGDDLNNDKAPDDWMTALGSLPLIYQPGDRLNYGLSTDVLGVLIARITGKPLGEVMKQRVFDPLAMSDTGFPGPAMDCDRVATMYRFDDGMGRLVPVDLPAPDEPAAFSAGGVGLLSTADDYLRFARMLLGEGELDGVRLLTPATVRDMRTNRLTPAQRAIPFIGAPTWTGMGFGLGLGIVDAPDRNLLGCGGVGSFTWPGAFGTWWQADPVEDVVMLFMIQHWIDYTPDSGAAIAGCRGMAGRMALPAFQHAVYGVPAVNR